MEETNEEQQKVISSNLDEQIIVNAQPGTGKTYTVAKKIEYIIKNNKASQDEILIICFSRSAVREVINRIELDEYEKSRITIRTIDSFCSWIIKEIKENEYKEIFNNSTYDDRIKYVIKLLNAEDDDGETLRNTIKSLKHIIIDEVQDIVGLRAILVLELLRIYNSGFTLLGDECQAIYDYQSKEMSSKQFYEEIYSTFEKAKKIEYKIQNRLNKKIEPKAKILRYAIQSKNTKIIENVVTQILRSTKEKELEEVEDGVILTRRNGYVFDISRRLKRPYQILNNTNPFIYPKWIGYIFGNFEKEAIEKEEFIEIAKSKLHQNEIEKLEVKWKILKEIEAKSSEILDIKELHKNIIISSNNILEKVEEKNKVTLATVHKAKGKEFNNVYINSELQKKESDILEYGKLIYVALTRTKDGYYKLKDKKKAFRLYISMGQKRSVECIYKKGTYKRQGKYKLKSIKKIEIGIENDVDKLSFINNKIIKNVEKNIEYINNNIDAGDLVDLILEGDYYYIYHNKRKIGKMNIENLYAKACFYINRTKNVTYKPKAYKNVRVKRVSTIAMFPEFIPSQIQNEYAKTGIWIGVELEGFGDLEWK